MSYALIKVRDVLLLITVSFFLASCGGGGGGDDDDGDSETPSLGSSATGSGSTGVFTNDGAVYALTPGGTGGGAGGTVSLLSIPNVGVAVGLTTVTQISSTPIDTSLMEISGTSVDPAHDIGLAYHYYDNNISFFKLSTATEITTYDTQTVNTISYSGASFATIVGAIMNPDNQTAIIATADGFEIVDYSNPSSPVKVREIPSFNSDPENPQAIEINENFGFHPALPVSGNSVAMIVSGGRCDECDFFGVNSMELANANTGKVYKPDAATQALFTHASYIDAVSIDTNYNVAVLAPEFAYENVLVDLNHLTLNEAEGTYTLPAGAVATIEIAGFEYTNISVESSNHLVMLGRGYGGATLLVGELENPSVNLGYKRLTTDVVPMPFDVDNNDQEVLWSGSLDPHGTGAYLTPSDHPTLPNTSMGLWAGGSQTHIAIINLENVLAGQLAEGAAYDPTDTSNGPKDIAYFAIP